MNETHDWQRIRHPLKMGILSSFMVLTGDMLLGWGMSDSAMTPTCHAVCACGGTDSGYVFGGNIPISEECPLPLGFL
jgi:hypothetical protein